jgi:hypothetical protein
MATVRISGNNRRATETEWLGAPALDDHGRIERTLQIPEEAYQRIEEGIAKGFTEGRVLLPAGVRFTWFLDR